MFKFLRVEVSVVVMHAPIEGDVEERNKLWNDLNGIMCRVGCVCREI